MISTSFTTKPLCPPDFMTTQMVCHEGGERGVRPRSNLPGTIRTLDDARGSIPIIHGRPCGSSASPLLREKAGEAQARLDHFETMRERKDGTLIPISLISPVKNAAGTIIGVSKIGGDISVRTAMDAERATRVKRLAELHRGSLRVQRSGHDAHLVRPAHPDRLAAMLATRPREPNPTP